MLGDDPDVAALQIATAMQAADFELAFTLLGRFAGDEQKTVAAKAVELGADSTIIDSMLAAFGSGETIVITARAPSTRIFPRWPLIVVGLLGLAAGAYFQAARLAK